MINESEGTIKWKQNLHELTGFNASVILYKGTLVLSRSAPTVAGHLLIVGSMGRLLCLGLEERVVSLCG